VIRYVMPWKATGPGDLTILRAQGRRLTKLIAPGRIVDYDRPLAFEVEAVRLEDVEDLAALLEDLAGQPDRCVIRGVLRPAFATRKYVFRRARESDAGPGRFEAVARAWVMVDIEPTTAPPWIDPVDPVLVGGYLRRQLPAPFQSARCAVQLSSGAGVKPGLRAHLWFSRPLGKPELDRWLKGVVGIDLQVFVSVQPHYTAAPAFQDVDDPVHERLALLPGYAEVAVPDLAPPAPRPAFAARPHRGGGGAEAYAAACLRRLALAPEGQRHRTCVAVSCRLLALAKAGLLDPARVAAMVKGVMVGRGFDGRSGRDLSEVDSILEWAWQQVEPEGLTNVS
jgi:hypothetical protein